MLIPADLEAGKTVSTAVYGPTLVAVEGSYDDVNRLCSEIAGEQEWAFVNVNVRPFYAEGSKTLGYEVAEQLGWRLPRAGRGPDRLRVAADQGRQGVRRVRPARPGRRQRRTGSSARRPTGCSPVAAAFDAGRDTVTPVRPNTIAKSLAIGNPADGPYALDVARRTGGAIDDVTDDEIVEGIRLLARPRASSPRPPAGSPSPRCSSCCARASSTRTPRR